MKNIEDLIYLDNNATTPVDSRVLDAMLPFLKGNFANANSAHSFGNYINKSVKIARAQIAELIGAEENEIIFTSGSTEAINIAIKGVAAKFSHKGKHIVTVQTEHKAVLETCKYLEYIGYEVTYLPVNKNGLIDLELLKSVLHNETILVCVMYVNNETGVIQPIKEIVQLTHEYGALFMTDATQAIGKIEMDVNELEIDLLCFSGHKMYAPKGIGVLFINNQIQIQTFIHGGGHEKGIRSGTLNVPGIIALAKACEIAVQEMSQDAKNVQSLRNELENGLLQLSGTFINGDKVKRIYNVTNICFPKIDANVMIGQLKNIAVSSGSACSSLVVEPSHVLTGMGLSNEDAFSSIRFSLGRYNTRIEVVNVIENIFYYLDGKQIK